MSLLSWERGLKSFWLWYNTVTFRRSSRGSVDWNPKILGWIKCPRVAPLVGAWIEMLNNCFVNSCNNVAPLVGAWIEMVIYDEAKKDFAVAPLVGAWIEIEIKYYLIRAERSRSSRGSVDWNLFPQVFISWHNTSLLSWERGLKSCRPPGHPIRAPSLLSWERGLKYGFIIKCTGLICRSSRGSVDWNSFFMPQFRHKEVAPLVGAWIEIHCYSIRYLIR